MTALVIDSSLPAAWCFPDERTDYTNAVLRVVATPRSDSTPLVGLCSAQQHPDGIAAQTHRQGGRGIFSGFPQGFAHTVDRSAFLRRRVQPGRPSRADRL